MFTPGRRDLVSAQHADLVEALNSVKIRLTNLSVPERAILKMTIDLLDYLQEYAYGPTNEEWYRMSSEERERLLSARRAREASPTFKVEEFQETLICSGGVELHSGRVAPRL